MTPTQMLEKLKTHNEKSLNLLMLCKTALNNNLIDGRISPMIAAAVMEIERNIGYSEPEISFEIRKKS